MRCRIFSKGVSQVAQANLYSVAAFRSVAALRGVIQSLKADLEQIFTQNEVKIVEHLCAEKVSAIGRVV